MAATVKPDSTMISSLLLGGLPLWAGMGMAAAMGRGGRTD